MLGRMPRPIDSCSGGSSLFPNSAEKPRSMEKSQKQPTFLLQIESDSKINFVRNLMTPSSQSVQEPVPADGPRDEAPDAGD